MSEAPEGRPSNSLQDGTYHQNALGLKKKMKTSLIPPLDPDYADAVHQDAANVVFSKEEEVPSVLFCLLFAILNPTQFQAGSQVENWSKGSPHDIFQVGRYCNLIMLFSTCFLVLSVRGLIRVNASYSHQIQQKSMDSVSFHDLYQHSWLTIFERSIKYVSPIVLSLYFLPIYMIPKQRKCAYNEHIQRNLCQAN